jgi:ornithine carbamoyltransferase
MAIVQLGGHPVTIKKGEVEVGTRESPDHVARTLACYHSLIAARVHDDEVLSSMAGAVHTPVLNMLSKKDHPLQALADLLTIEQLAGGLQGTRIAFVGAANNVARSLAEGCSLLGASLTVASPSGFGLTELPRHVRQVIEPAEAVEGAQFVYTDRRPTDEQLNDSEELRSVFEPYQVNSKLMERSASGWFMHSLPAQEGEEVTGDVINGPRSAIWLQVENRMHTARGAMAWMLGVQL